MMLINIKENLVMRTRLLEDADEIFTTIDKDREYLRKWLPWVDSTTDVTVTQNVIRKWEEDEEKKSEFVFGIFLDNKYVGNIGLHDVKSQNNSAMIGYWISKDYQGMGIMTDCVKNLMAFGFDGLNLNRIYIHCASDNSKSRAIPERLGFVKEGVLQDEECLYGKYYDLVVYGMLKRNWGKCNE